MGIRIDRVRELVCSLIVLLLASYAWMFSKVSVPNERTRAYLTVAIVDHGSVAIDAPLRRFGSVYDLASFGGQHFTDKAPGSSLLAVPIYALVRLWTRAQDWDIVALCNLFRTWLMLPFGVLGFVVLRALLRLLGVSDLARELGSLGFSLGSPVLHYSGALYGHVPVAVLTLSALLCLSRAGLLGPRRAAADGGKTARAVGVDPERSWAGPLVSAAGACAGLAGLIEYQAIVLAALLALPIAFGPRGKRLRQLSLYAAGAAPFALGLLWYNARAFGGPFELSYQHLVGSSLQELHGFGLAGATSPTRARLHAMLTSEHRGLLITAPFLGFGLFALPFIVRRLGLALWLTAALGVSYFGLIVASSSVWFGGWSFGLRLLIPIYGLLALSAAVGFDGLARWPALQSCARAALIVSILYQQIVQVSFPELPPEFTRPLPDVVLPMLSAGLFAPNLGCKLLGLEPVSLWPLAPLTLLLVGWVAGYAQARPRWLWASATLVLAGFACAWLCTRPPRLLETERTRWLRLVRNWSQAETGCAGTVSGHIHLPQTTAAELRSTDLTPAEPVRFTASGR